MGDTSSSENVPVGITAHVTISACGRVLHTQNYGGPDTPNVGAGAVTATIAWRDKIEYDDAPRSLDHRITFNDPTRPVLTGTHYASPKYPASCDDVNPANDNTDEPTAITVLKWSAKKGATTAKVGKTVKVTPTRAGDAKVIYVAQRRLAPVRRDRAALVVAGVRARPAAGEWFGSRTERRHVRTFGVMP